MKLYSSPYSSNARKVRLAAALLGIPLELVDVNLGQGARDDRLVQAQTEGHSSA